MKLTKKILLAALSLCLSLGVAVFVAACKKKPATYAVTYAFGSYESTAYAGTSTLPTQSDTEAEGTFALAAAPVWEGYDFLGWNDGTTIYDAGATYTMPAHAVTLTAQWEAEQEEPVTPTTYKVTYAFGSYESTAYAGTSTLPTQSETEAEGTFALAAAPVWEGYDFLGWNDGTTTYGAGATYTMPAHAVTLTAQWEAEQEEPVTPTTYKVTYAFGSCDETAYAGTSTLPTQSDTEAEGTFALAAVPVWEGYDFLGWNDGTTTYDAGATYTMPAHAVTLTAQWEAINQTYANVTIGTWGSALSENYTVKSGRYVEYTGEISAKGSEGYHGIVSQIFLNGDETRWYFLRPDCPATYTVATNAWEWWDTSAFESNTSLDASKYAAATAGTVHIVAALSEEGELVYTLEFSSASYSYTNVYTFKTKADSAVVYFAADGTTADATTVIVGKSVLLSFDWNTTEQKTDTYTVSGSNYTFGENPTRDGYAFLGWQVDGKGEYYGQGQTYRLNFESVSFVAAWGDAVEITIDENGGTGTVETPVPVYNAETKKFEIALPSAAGLGKDGYSFDKWEVRVNNALISVTGDSFDIALGDKAEIKAIWLASYTVTYHNGSYDGKAYSGTSLLPNETDKSEGEAFTVKGTPEWSGYDFLGWSDGSDDGKLYHAGDTYTVAASNVTLTAQWQMHPTHSVTFNPGSYVTTPYAGSTNIDTREDTPEGMVFPLARTLYWEGYTFTGWREDDTDNIYEAIQRYTMPDHDVSFTAQWTKNLTHTISYVANAGDDTVLNMPEDTTYFDGQAFRQIPIRFGYTFTGWNDGTKTYKTGETLPVEDDADITLTAQWKEYNRGNEEWVILSGIWEYDRPDGTGKMYLIISGLECEFDWYMTHGYTQAGTFGSATVTDTTIKFRFYADRGYNYSGKGTKTCTYDFESDTIKYSTYTFTRTTVKCTYSATDGYVLETDTASVEEYALPADTKETE